MDDLDALTKDELLELARQYEIEGRSGMNKDELAAAVRDARAAGAEPLEDVPPSGAPLVAPGAEATVAGAEAAETFGAEVVPQVVEVPGAPHPVYVDPEIAQREERNADLERELREAQLAERKRIADADRALHLEALDNREQELLAEIARVRGEKPEE